MKGKSPEQGTRIIAIGDPGVTLADLFDGLTVNQHGDVKVGETTLHEKEFGPALAKCVMVLNDHIEQYADHELAPDRAMFYFPQGFSGNHEPNELELYGGWVYSRDNLDIRVMLLEAVVQQMRQKPIPTS